MSTFDPNPEYSESVRTALANELQRRRRVFMIYLLLVALPIGLAIYAVMRAPLDTEVVANQVSSVVVKRVNETIGPRVSEAVATQAKPIILDAVAAEVNQAVGTAVAPVAKTTESLEKRYVALDSQVSALGSRVQRGSAGFESIAQRMADLDALQGRLGQAEIVARDTLNAASFLRQRDEKLSAQLGAATQQNHETAAALAELTARVAAMEKQIGALQTDVKGMRESVRWRIYHKPQRP
jgi:hypothetical protein